MIKRALTKFSSTSRSPLARTCSKMFGSKCETASNKTSSEEEDVIIKDVDECGVLILNRPRVLNALNLSMIKKMYPVLKKWESTKKLVLIKGTGDKAFCAGGDVKSVVQALQKPNGDELGKQFFRSEYILNYLIGTYKIPYIAIINGITMGGGVGLSVHGKYRIASDKTVFAMPETAIGLFPDVGGSYFLSRLEGKLGSYLGMTGHRLKGADVAHAGIATHFVPSKKIESVCDKLLSKDANIKEILKPYRRSGIKEKFSLAPHIDVIDHCFQAPTVEEVILRLKAKDTEWSLNVVKDMSKLSPTSLKVTKRAIDEGGEMSLSECFTMEYRLVCACLEKNSDFAEGVRALLLDKDQKPAWNPDKIIKVTDEMINKRFAPLPKNELQVSKL